MKTSLSARNNNPLNLRNSRYTWVGQTGVSKGFCVFDNDVNGYRAAMKNLLGYIGRYGLKSPKSIISKWAPATENDVESYVSVVCRLSDGVLQPDQELRGCNDFRLLVRLMCFVERGVMGVQKDIDAGFNKLLSGSLSLSQRHGLEWLMEYDVKFLKNSFL